ncbi:MAG: Glutathione S-transferase YfcF [Pseudomonadota bacterium]|jgi:glutathione S-transferase|nr:glutathione S-transferase family protein [Betaproteobacteria bacterium]
MKLYIGNKNYSSWSMRPWVLMTELGMEFEEVMVPFDFSPQSSFYQTVTQVNPAGKVPVLVDEGFAVWDTLAIAEYLHEKFPGHGVWPTGQRERARGRSISAEMHSGFSALRTHCPMNLEAQLPEVGARIWAEQPGVRKDMARIEALWSDGLQTHGGPFLLGAFSAADAFFAPVCTRLQTYGLPLSATARGYVERIVSLASVRQWTLQAQQEHQFIAEDEPYRTHR